MSFYYLHPNQMFNMNLKYLQKTYNLTDDGERKYYLGTRFEKNKKYG